jgi:hypothetical protein
MLRESNWCKEVITKEKTEELFRTHDSFGWNYVFYLYTPRNIPKQNSWDYFIDKFKEL